MGLVDGKCDSCGKERSVLVPLAVLDELPTGGLKLVMKYYCRDCADCMLDDSDELDEEDEEE